MNVSGDREFTAPRAQVWRVLNDPASMAKTMPGVESFDVHDDRRWTANVKIPLGLGGLKMKIHKACIARLFERNDLVLDAETIAEVATELTK